MQNLITIIFLLFQILASAQSWTEVQVKDSTAVRVLKGTLLIPEGKAEMPVALIIAGSGPTDRNGNNPAMKGDYLKMLAEGLAAQGIASLRYDKRGIGQSTVATKSEEALVIEDFANDAASWLIQLKADRRFTKVIVLGHSEGSLLGMIACQQQGRADAFVSLAGAGRPVDQILKEQLLANPNNPPDMIKNAGNIIDTLKLGLRPKLVSPLLVRLFRPSIQPYLISWMKYDPGQEIRKLSMAVMIVQGTTDIQVSMKDAEALQKARPDARYFAVDGMNHVFRDAPMERSENIKTYTQPDKPLNATLIPALIDFIAKVK